MNDAWVQRNPVAFTGPRIIVSVSEEQIAAYERDLAWMPDLHDASADTRVILKAADKHGGTR